MIDSLLIGTGFAFACVVQPGPLQAFLFSQSLLNGWKKTIPLVFAPLVTDGPIILLVLFAATRSLGSRVNRILIGISVIVLIIFGIYQLWAGMSGFISFSSPGK